MGRNRQKTGEDVAAARRLAQWRPNGETCDKPSVPDKPRKIFFDLA
jgi:hypothetical protein